MRSRSLATAFIRFVRPSAAKNGVISVYTVALAAIAARTIVMNRGSWNFSSRNSIMRHHQKSKLIIFFITKMPADIHTTQAASISRPVGWVQSSEM